MVSNQKMGFVESIGYSFRFDGTVGGGEVAGNEVLVRRCLPSESGALKNRSEKESLRHSFFELSLGNSRFGSSMGMVGNENFGEEDCGSAWRNQGLNGVGIGFAFGEVLTSRSNEKGSDIARNDEKKKTQKESMGHLGCQKLGPKYSWWGKKSMDNVSEVGNGMDVQKSHIQSTAMPDGLKELLLNSGWMVVSREGLGEAVYVSPSGSTYGSLPKALEAFSRDISKPTNKRWGMPPSIDDGGLKRNHVSPAPDLASKIGPVSRDVVKSVQKKKRRSSKRKKPLARVGPVRPTMLIKDKLQRRMQELNEDIATESLSHKDVTFCMVKEKAKSCTKDASLSREVKDSACLMSEAVNIDENSAGDMHQNVKLSSIRRSARINGKHVRVHYESDLETEADEGAYLDSSKQVSTQLSLRLEEVGPREEAPKLVASCMGDHKVVASCVGDHKRVSSCMKEGSSSGVTESSGCSRMEVETENSDFCRTDSMNEGSSKSNLHQDGKLLGVRRSVRINGKRVPVDSDFDLIMEAGDDYLGSSECVIYRAARKGMEALMTPTLKVENVEARIPTRGKKSIKQTSRKKINHQKTENRKDLRKGNGVRTPVSTKCSPSKRNGGKALILEKRSPSSTSKRKSVGGGISNGKKKKKRSGGCSLTVRRLGKGDHEEKISPETKASILSWLIDAGVLTENEKVMYKNKNCGSMLKGWVTKGGIRCNCCKKVMSLLEFEAHAGRDLRQPWDNTHLGSGRSLLSCLLEAWEKEKKLRKVGFQIVGVNDPDPSDDTCGVCADGGSLICCDNCPSTFHQDCVMLKALPEGSWYCPYCRCALCMMVKQVQDRTRESFMLLKCIQCGRRYHRECAWGHDLPMMGSESLSFCGIYCKKVAEGLSNMLGVTKPTEEGFSWTVLRRIDEDKGISSNKKPSFIMECNAKLSLSLSVLEECFVPLVDPRSSLDMLTQAVYNCGIHGTRSAEMPFIGTRPMYRRQGMCRRLLKAVEEMLSSLHVEKLIIPAIPDLLETWMTSFSFKPLELSHREEIKNLVMIVFAETILLQKSICKPEMEDERGGHTNPDSQDVPLWQIPQCKLSGTHDAIFGPCKEIKGGSSVPDALPPLCSSISSRFTSEILPVQTALLHNIDMVPRNLGTGSFSFSSVGTVLPNSSVNSEVISSPRRHVRGWLQSADDAKDAHPDVICCSLPVDSLLSIRS
ncbi:uncharacterized protein LOC131235489 isoform X2 [Magnolia sinica]|uniref:uncharacterized protein LOC131235489 isoform X2 n=1 Tax=Magnolia sinica TaxID=86752 RepID=UPI00265B03BA|nr:uncharacterized protein LOC131235489 isoform X2 [Magnolia sinica]